MSQTQPSCTTCASMTQTVTLQVAESLDQLSQSCVARCQEFSVGHAAPQASSLACPQVLFVLQVLLWSITCVLSSCPGAWPACLPSASCSGLASFMSNPAARRLLCRTGPVEQRASQGQVTGSRLARGH